MLNFAIFTSIVLTSAVRVVLSSLQTEHGETVHYVDSNRSIYLSKIRNFPFAATPLCHLGLTQIAYALQILRIGNQTRPFNALQESDGLNNSILC